MATVSATSGRPTWIREAMLPVFGLLFVALACMHAFGVSWTEVVGEPVMITTAFAAVVFRLVRSSTPDARYFWAFVAVSHLAYLSTFTFTADWFGEQGVILGLLEDLLLLMSYAGFFVAITYNPHAASHERVDRQQRRIETLGAIVFSVGLITYFVLIPAVLGADWTESYTPSLFVYVLLDASVVASFLYLRTVSGGSRWRTTYGLLACTYGMWMTVDLTEALMYAEMIPYLEPGLFDLCWYLPHLTTVLAASADIRTTEHSEHRQTKAPARQFGFGVPITLFLVFAPAMHFGLYAIGILAPDARQVREGSVFVVVAILGGLAIVKQRRRAREHRRLDEHVRQSQKMDAIGRLAGGIAHDINNVLTVISANSEFVLTKLAGDDLLRPDIEAISTAGERAARLTRQLLAVSHRQRLDMRTLDLNGLTSDLARMLDRILPENVTLHFEPAPAPCIVRVDGSQLEQVLLNLAINAKDAMPRGGQIVIGTRLEPVGSGWPALNGGSSGMLAALSVRDTGTGMDEETLRQAFDPFFTTKERGHGVGLGLTTAYGIVKQHGGEFVISSRPGEGTTMTIFLPALDAEADVPAPPPTKESRGRQGETILVVEDEPEVREVVRRTLERNGYRVLTAESGSAARSVFATNRDQVSLLLTDVVMPGQSGPQLYDALAMTCPGLKVLFMTGYSPSELFPHPAVRHPVIAKPFEAMELCTRIREILDAQPALKERGERA